MEKLKAWKWAAFLPIILIWALGWAVIACGQRNAAAIVVTVAAIALPTFWSLVAMYIVLTLGEKGRASASGTRQPVLFFICWGISSVVTRGQLFQFPDINPATWLSIINFANIAIIISVIVVFVLKCLADSRK